MTEKKMTKKEALKMYKMVMDIVQTQHAYFFDSTYKAFLALKKKAENDIEFYSKTNIKGVSNEAQEEIVRILESYKRVIEREFEIIMHRDHADCLKPQYTLEMIENGDIFKGGFGGVLTI